jgi:hypothetical protein
MLFTLVSLNLCALDISLQGAKENFQNYSILHIKEKNKFLCEAKKNDFDVTTKIICAFSQSPTKKLKALQNDFFKIETKISKGTFFVIVTPYKKMKLYPVVFDLSKDESVYEADVKLSSHWMIVGYNEELPYIKTHETSDISINFPFILDKDMLPYVGSLDIKGNPVHLQEVKDVSDYLKIKEYYAKGDYERCLNLVDEVMLEFPTSLFNAELLYYKIRVNSKLKNSDDVIALSKIYLREYSSDDNIAEVLALISQAYAINGVDSQADYFFDRLFDEHENSPYAKWGYIYKGEMLEDSGEATKALEYYKKALNETNDVEIAAAAAYNIAQYKINNSAKEEASTYAMKIVNGNPDYFSSKYTKSLEMMNLFAEEAEYDTASKIANALINEKNKIENEYEELVKNRGLWLSKTPQKEEALAYLNEYLKTFPDGLYEPEVQVAKDSLFFYTSDANVTTKIDDYNALIATYTEDSIGKKALYEKAKLMNDNAMYAKVLELKNELLNLDEVLYPDTQTIVNTAALGVMEIALKNKECHSVLKISGEYSIKLSDKWDDGIYECAMKGADFELAKSITSKNLKSTDLDVRKKWLYRYIKVDFATGNYSDVVKASQELIVLISGDNDSVYKDVYRVLFDTYQRLENTQKMIETIASIEKVYGVNYKDIERYIAVMAIGSDKKDDNLVIQYANKVMKIQKDSNSNAQSPFVEFALYQAYINKKELNEAFEVIKSLDDVEISKPKRSRQKYLLGSVLDKLWRGEEAQIAYKDAIKADSTSAWAKLAEGAKED